MKNTHRFFVVPFLVIGVTAGCQTGPQVEETAVEAALEPAPKPEPLPVGSKVVGVYDGEETATAEKVSIEGPLHTYVESPEGCRWTRDADLDPIFSPSVSWNNCDGSSGTVDISSKNGDIWPLQVGSKVSFEGTGKTSSTWPADMTCKVVDEARITVKAGTYDTYKVYCSSRWRSITRYYAPSIERVVMMSQRRKNQSNASSYDWELVRVE